MPKQEIEVTAASSNAETTSPLLSSLLKSPSTAAATTTTTTTAPLPTSQHVQSADVDDVEVKHVDEKDAVDEPMETNDVSVAANVESQVNDVGGEESEPKSEENVEELLAAAVDEVTEKMPDLISILAGVENGETANDAENEVEVKAAAAESNDVVVENGVEPRAEVPQLDVQVDAIKQEVSESCADETNHEEVANTCDVEKTEASNDADLSCISIKTEDDSQADDKTLTDEDKPLTSADLKRLPKVSSASKGGRRSRKQSDVNADEDSSEARRETRSKKTSERSDECSGTPGTGSGNLETASEESPLPPPSVGSRETRRSAAKKGPSNDAAAADGTDSVKDEKDELTALNVAENRRLSRLKEKETSGEFLIHFIQLKCFSLTLNDIFGRRGYYGIAHVFFSHF